MDISDLRVHYAAPVLIILQVVKRLKNVFKHMPSLLIWLKMVEIEEIKTKIVSGLEKPEGEKMFISIYRSDFHVFK